MQEILSLLSNPCKTQTEFHLHALLLSHPPSFSKTHSDSALLSIKLLQMRIHLHNRARIRLFRKQEIIPHTNQQHRPRNNDRKIHHRKVHKRGLRPAAKEDNKHEIANRNDVIGDAQGAFETPRSPRQAAIVCLVDLAGVEDGHGGVWIVQVAAEAPPEEEPDGDEVGEVESL